MKHDESALEDLARFMQHVYMTGRAECWLWIGNKPDGRYGHFSVSGKIYKAHRWLYALVCGEIPEGMVIRHKCDNPSCVNPAHLTIGTHADNVADKYERGRAPNRQGEKHPLARLTEDKVKEIRRMSELGWPNSRIAAEFGVSTQHVGKVVRRENWRHV